MSTLNSSNVIIIFFLWTVFKVVSTFKLKSQPQIVNLKSRVHWRLEAAVSQNFSLWTSWSLVTRSYPIRPDHVRLDLPRNTWSGSTAAATVAVAVAVVVATSKSLTFWFRDSAVSSERLRAHYPSFSLVSFNRWWGRDEIRYDDMWCTRQRWMDGGGCGWGAEEEGG